MFRPGRAALLASWLILPGAAQEPDDAAQDRPEAVNTAVPKVRTSEDDPLIRAALDRLVALQTEDGGFAAGSDEERRSAAGRVLVVVGIDGTTVVEGRYVDMARAATLFLARQIDAESGRFGSPEAELGPSHVLGMHGLHTTFQSSGVKVLQAPLIATTRWLAASRPDDGVWGGDEATVGLVGPATLLETILLSADFGGVKGDRDAAVAGLDWLLAAAAGGDGRDALHAAAYALDAAEMLERELAAETRERLEAMVLAVPTPPEDGEVHAETEYLIARAGSWMRGRRMVEFLRPRDARVRALLRERLESAERGEAPPDARELATLVGTLQMISLRVHVTPRGS